MNDYYRMVKPVLNKLSELNIWDSLYVIRQYACSYNDNLGFQKPHFESIEEYQKFSIPPYFVDFLIEASLKYSDLKEIQTSHNLYSKNISLRQLKTRSKIVSCLSEAYNDANKNATTEVELWLKAYVQSQRKMQHYEVFTDRIITYYDLFKSANVAKKVQEELRMDIDEFFQLILLFFHYFSNHFSCSMEDLVSYLSEGSRKKELNVMKVLYMLSISLEDLKKDLKLDFSEKMFFILNDAPHIKHPIFVNEDMLLYCPIPIYILNNAVEGLQYHLDLLKDAKLYNEYATNFENYVGNLLASYGKTGKYKYTKEFSYDKGQNKTSDWLIYDDKCIIFLDCKLKKLPIVSIKNLSLDDQEVLAFLTSEHLSNRKKREENLRKIGNSLAQDIIQLGIDLGKILCCYCDWKLGKLPAEIPYNNNLAVSAVILTLEETYCDMQRMKMLIDKVAIEYVKVKKGMDLDLSVIKTNIISCTDFNSSIPFIEKDGLYKHVVENDFKIEDNNYLRNEYLRKRFSDFLKLWGEKEKSGRKL